MAYTPPDSHDIIFDFTDSGYSPDAYDSVDLDFEGSKLWAINPKVTVDYTDSTPPAGHMVDGDWQVNPTNVKPITPWFQATFGHDPSLTDPEATAVYIEVRRTSDLVLVWGSGWLDFAEYDAADHPILPYHNHVMRAGEFCELIYQHDDNSQAIPTALLRLPRDGTAYQWRVKFYFDALSLESSWAEGNFTQFLEEYYLLNPEVEGATNPTDVTDITPEFDADYDATYTSRHTPILKQYQIQVANDSGFSTILWNYTLSSLSLSPGHALPTLTYAGTALSRDGLTKYWKIRAIIETEWGDVTTSWITTQYFTMLLETMTVSNVRINGLTTPTIKDYYPEFIAQFNDNYSPARAVAAQVQVCNYVGSSPDWGSIKWDSGFLPITSTPPSSDIPTVDYPSPYPSGDSGFYWDGTRFGVRIRLQVSSDGTYYTDWSTTTYFDMGVATIDALLPRVDEVYGPLRVRTFTPAFDAQYETDAYDPISANREYANYVNIQVSTSSSNWTTYLVWDSDWVELTPHILDTLGIGVGPYSDMKSIPLINPGTGSTYLTAGTTYYWRIRFRNERSLVGNWSEIMSFTCMGYVLSAVSDTDIINAFWGDKEYEVYVESKTNVLYLTLINVTDGILIINSLGINKGVQPRLIFNSDTGIITLLFLNNGKLYSRTWSILDTPDVAPSTAPQLIDGAVDIIRTLPNPVDIMDIAQRPYVPGGSPVKIYRGSICDQTGNLFPGKSYIVEFTIPSNHAYFYNDKTYKVYVQNGIYEGSYNELNDYALDDIAVGALAYVPASDLGCDITNTQRTRLGPWLSNMIEESDEYIESLPVRAIYSGTMAVEFDKFGYDSSWMGCVSTDSTYKYSLTETWLYKKTVNVPEDELGITESLMGCVSTDSTYKYSLTETWLYKKSVYISEDNFGLTESMMGAMYTEINGPHEWTSGDYNYGQHWSVYNYYDARIR